MEPPRDHVTKLPDDEESRELDCVFLPVDLELIALVSLDSLTVQSKKVATKI